MILTKKQKETIIKHAKELYPNEACGIIAGRENRALAVHTMQNTSDTPTLCYFMNPKEQLKVMKRLRTNGLEMIGIYHSHATAPAYPSSKDVELAFYPDALYVIISLRKTDEPEMAGFRIIDGKIKKVKIRFK